MNELLLRLAERIRGECAELDRVVERIREGWQRAQQTVWCKNLVHFKSHAIL